MIRISPARRAALQRIVFPVLVILSVVAILLGKLDQRVFEPLRISLTDAAAPALEALSRPIATAGNLIDRADMLANLYKENVHLQDDNDRLLRWQQVALRLASENAELRRLLKLVPQPMASYVTARVIANSGGAFARNLLVDAGSDSGVARGQAVITGDGLVGRIAEVGTRAARILLLTDLNSHIPVIIERTRQRAILSGDNSERPLLEYRDPAAAVDISDRIVTSGEGGVFPPGLPVGVVSAVNGGAPRVALYVELSRVEYVRIVDYGLTSGLPEPVPAVTKAEPAARPKKSQTALGKPIIENRPLSAR